ncbi:PKD-like family lipoprotein [Pedobacter sp.]|uniref:PKD-like family lipoprotein n=1 Tax=Pedobacter sp. TaxID=1411316 RepID=UPI003D7FAEFA
MKIHHYTLILLSFLFATSCSKDIGVYDYHDINELKISGIASTINLRRTLDTLRLNPIIDATLDDGEVNRYSYAWVLQSGPMIFDTIGREKNLNYPILLNPGPYSIYYRVLDKKTGIKGMSNITLNVSTAFSRGLLIMGEDEEGYAEAEMLSMLNDTIHFKHILSESGLPRLREPMNFFHTGGTYDPYIKLWVNTKTQSYYLDRVTLKSTPANTLSRLIYASEPIDQATLHPIVIAPQVTQTNGNNSSSTSGSSYRVVLTKAGDIFASFLALNGGDFYTNPVNKASDAPTVRLVAAPYLLYPINNMSSFMWYDIKNQRFLNFTSFGSTTPAAVLTDKDTEPFPWNQAKTGRKLVYAENTRAVESGYANGISFAIMKDPANVHYVYKFYANGSAPAKIGAYTISSIATNFDKADFYAFSSNRTVIFYSVGNRLYAYDYNPGKERIYEFPALGNDQITMLKFDTQINYATNSLYIATYNSSTKGTLRRFIVGSNPNVVELLPQENSTWTNMVKIKDINWRGLN